jgi:hypothetical protein
MFGFFVGVGPSCLLKFDSLKFLCAFVWNYLQSSTISQMTSTICRTRNPVTGVCYYNTAQSSSIAPQLFLDYDGFRPQNGSPSANEHAPLDANRFKTKLCRQVLRHGACPYESRCMFAHNPEELRTADMNRRDGLISEDAIRAFRRMIYNNMMASNPPSPFADGSLRHSDRASTPTEFNSYNSSCDDSFSSCSGANSSRVHVYTHDPYGVRSGYRAFTDAV